MGGFNWVVGTSCVGRGIGLLYGPGFFWSQACPEATCSHCMELDFCALGGRLVFPRDVKIPLSRVIVLSLLLSNFKT